jgi:hypothetical protein
MALLTASERHFAEVLSRLVNTNPFLPEWVTLERQALGPDFREAPAVYSRRGEWDDGHLHPNVELLGERADTAAEQARRRLAEGTQASDRELALYDDLALYHLYGDSYEALSEAVVAEPGKERDARIAAAWDGFAAGCRFFFAEVGRALPDGHAPEHLFAVFFQMRRAFHHTYTHILGSSTPAARLRGAVWQSIFTHDMRRWGRTLYGNMANFPTLVTGPSGTGKELVARALGLSRYVPFDPKRKRFTAEVAGSFYPLNLSALAPTLIESELFGHIAGAFTGAVKDRMGRLEECDKHKGYGTVFLDEVGELDAGLQVKLLRVLQARRFQRLGENADKPFRGKIIAATNRDLAAEMQAGRFRADFYYRLCADRITTPSLAKQLADSPDDLYNLLLFIARRELGGAEGEARALAEEATRWIEENLGRAYGWPGNFRELEQCVRNLIIRRAYEPVQPGVAAGAGGPRPALAAAVAAGALTAGELERRYFTLVYADAGSYQEAARRLDCNWRTLRAKIDPDYLRELNGDEGGS